jgi:hypothetical protein
VGDDAVVKLYRPGYLGHRPDSVALTKLDGHRVAPRLIDIVDCDGCPGLVLERLGGSDMLELLQRQPWRVLDLARALAKATSPSTVSTRREIFPTVARSWPHASKTPPCRRSCGHSRRVTGQRLRDR